MYTRDSHLYNAKVKLLSKHRCSR